MATLVFPGKVRENPVIQAQLADVHMETIQNEHIWHDVIKEAPVKLSVAIALAKNIQRILEKVKGKREQVQSQDMCGEEDRKAIRDKKLKPEEVKLEERKEVTNRRMWALGKGFLSPHQGS